MAAARCLVGAQSPVRTGGDHRKRRADVRPADRRCQQPHGAAILQDLGGKGVQSRFGIKKNRALKRARCIVGASRSVYFPESGPINRIVRRDIWRFRCRHCHDRYQCCDREHRREDRCELHLFLSFPVPLRPTRCLGDRKHRRWRHLQPYPKLIPPCDICHSNVSVPVYQCAIRAAKSRTQKRVNNAIRNEWINQTAANNH